MTNFTKKNWERETLVIMLYILSSIEKTLFLLLLAFVNAFAKRVECRGTGLLRHVIAVCGVPEVRRRAGTSIAVVAKG